MAKKHRSKADIEVEVRQRVAAEETAYRWVEKLALVECISREELVEMTNTIMMSHYQDIVEERAISKVCGYPLCNNKLTKIGKQKFHISMKSNKVYDMSERKFFCSTYCFKASKYIETQIPESPVWLRGSSNQREVKVLEKDDKVFTAIESREVPISNETLKVEDIENELLCSVDNEPSICKNNKDHVDYWNELDEKSRGKESNLNVKRTSTKLITDNINSLKIDEDVIEQLNKLVNRLREWFTDKSYKYMKLNSQVQSTNLSSNGDVKLCRSSSEDTFQAKAMHFLSKNPDWVTESNLSSVLEKKLNTNNQETKKIPIVPTIDSKSQNAIRIKIVKEKIISSMTLLRPIFGLTNSELIENGFFKFIDTFRFTSHNIVLKAKQWLLITVLLLKIFSICMRNVSEAFCERTEEIENFLMNHEFADLDAINIAVKEFLKDFLYFGDDESDDAEHDNINGNGETILFTGDVNLKNIIDNSLHEDRDFNIEELD